MTTTTENTPERRHEVRLKYDALFWRQPNVYAVSEGYLRTGGGGWLETKGINVQVTEKVDQSTLPLADRIPVCLEGIPVKITEEPDSGGLIPPLPLEEIGLSTEDINTDEEETNGNN